jgi:hypothetical protein
MYRSEFLELFTCGEVKEIDIAINGTAKKIYIRRLSYHDCSVFRKKCKYAVHRATFDSIVNAGKADGSVFSLPNEDVELGEYYLLRKSMCDQSGKKIFDNEDDEYFRLWLDSVNDDIANNIIKEIDIFNNLTKDYSAVEDDIKKK